MKKQTNNRTEAQKRATFEMYKGAPKLADKIIDSLKDEGVHSSLAILALVHALKLFAEANHQSPNELWENSSDLLEKIEWLANKELRANGN
jgi:hypothetical protein